jgi:phage/plasmid primase-like uncharacterized protein
MPLPLSQSFEQAIAAAGLKPPQVIRPDKIMRFPGFEKDPRNRSAWCRLFPDETGGVFGDWTTGLSETWQSHTFTERGPEWYEQIALSKRLMEQERQQAHDEAAAEAQQLFAEAADAPDDHPYLKSKGITASGAKIDETGHVLLVKMRDAEGKIRNIQRIFKDGQKRFHPNAQVSGTYWAIGKKEDAAKVFVVCEGWATGVSISKCTGYPVAVAFNRGNLENVVTIMRNKYPQATVILAADDDWKTSSNPGLTDAKRISESHGCRLVVPVFDEARRQDGDTDFNDMMRMLGAQAVADRFAQQEQAQQAAEDEAWTKPATPFAEYMLPSFPMDCLPPALSNYANALSEQSGFDAGGYAISFLALAGALIDQRAKMRAGPMQTPAFTWVGLVAPSGGGKSPVINAARALIQKIEEGILESSQRRMATYMEALNSLSREEKKSSPPEKPKWNQRIATDTTIEALGDLLRDNPCGMLMIQDEITEMIGRMDAYGNGGGGKDRGAYLRAFDGGSIVINRKNSGIPTKIDNFSLGVLAGIQPEKLAELFKKGGGGSDGLYQRFLVYCMGAPGQLNYGYEIPTHIFASASDLIESTHKWTYDGSRFLTSVATMSKEALQEMQDYHQNVRDLSYRTPAKRFSEHIGKFPGFLARIAFTLHCLDCVAANQWNPEVSKATLSKALRIVRVLFRHSEYVYELLDDSSGDSRELVQSAADAILSKGWTCINRSDLTRNATGWRSAPNQLTENAIDLLIELGWLRDDTPPQIAGKRGRRSTGVFKINPAVHQLFKKRAEKVREDREKRYQGIKQAAVDRASKEVRLHVVA